MNNWFAVCAVFLSSVSNVASIESDSTSKSRSTPTIKTESWLDKQALLDNLDRDHDGAVSLTEAVREPAFLTIFNALDTNKDGQVTGAELDAALKEKMAKEEG